MSVQSEYAVAFHIGSDMLSVQSKLFHQVCETRAPKDLLNVAFVYALSEKNPSRK